MQLVKFTSMFVRLSHGKVYQQTGTRFPVISSGLSRTGTGAGTVQNRLHGTYLAVGLILAENMILWPYSKRIA
jgi:hypothetical protein